MQNVQEENVWQVLAEELQQGRRAFLCLVGESSDGSPGTAGISMLLCEDGRQVGTIGGGRMELDLLGRARDALKDGSFTPEARRLWHRKSVQADTSGLICSGFQTNIAMVCDPSRDAETAGRICALLGQGRSGSVILSSSGLGLEEEEPDFSVPATQWAQASDGSWQCRHGLLNRKRVAIIGGGHCGRALSRTMSQLGYHVIVFDCRPDVETFLNNTWANRKEVVADYVEAGERIEFPAATRVVVMTTDYPSDVRALLGASRQSFPFVGVMGSLAKINRIKGDLRQQGVSQEWLDGLRAPIGLRIHSHTPEEIAISIAGELIADYFENDPGRPRQAPVDESELPEPGRRLETT